jgi:hypothetical protein
MRVLERRKKQRQAMEPQTKKQQAEPQTSDVVDIVEGIETVRWVTSHVATPVHCFQVKPNIRLPHHYSHGSDEWI